MLDGLRILLAEDNPTNQMVAVQMLEALGAGVTVASDGGEALEILETRDFDILLVDIEMPRKNGIEVIRTLRQPGGRHRDVPMIALTAYVMREHRQAIDAAGADGVIAKPIISIAEFGRQILDLAGRRNGRDARGPASDAGRAVAEAVPDRAWPEPVPAAAVDREALATLRQAVGAEAFAEILEKAQADLGDAGALLAAGVESGDETAIRGALHILTGLAGSVGADALDGAARAMQEAIHAGDSARAAALGEALPAAIEAALLDLGAAAVA
ncbi:response regulator [Limibaculum sp. FT325]|uniref:response regulator n=1 Tax=Thermohalobaculum sediminis TaxID=2939436 RepID=UPI0020C00CC4|nr:response regulator [Limibaculum sediminis]MCL5778061.1 response regulator [Limibaculum sediminis]